MKKLLLVLTFLLAPYQAQAGGIYDGVWQVTPSIFVTINQNGDSLAAIILQETIWEAQLGTLLGNEATLTTVYGWVGLTSRITFTSEATANITIVECNDGPSFTCLFPAGTSLTAVKVF